MRVEILQKQIDALKRPTPPAQIDFTNVTGLRPIKADKPENGDNPDNNAGLIAQQRHKVTVTRAAWEEGRATHVDARDLEAMHRRFIQASDKLRELEERENQLAKLIKRLDEGGELRKQRGAEDAAYIEHMQRELMSPDPKVKPDEILKSMERRRQDRARDLEKMKVELATLRGD